MEVHVTSTFLLGLVVLMTTLPPVPDTKLVDVELELYRALRDITRADREKEDEALEKLKEHLAQIVRFEAGGRVVPIASVNPCEQLEGDLRCNLVYRDELEHTAEGLDKIPTCWTNDTLRLVLPAAYGRPRVYAADGAAMHSEPKPRPREVARRPDGTLEVKGLQVSYDLFFIILKGPGERYMKKIVWALERKTPPAGETPRHGGR
jgi:hypothetical protein